MKTKSIILFLVVVSTINVFAQKQSNRSLFAFGGKSGDCIMTLDELKSCKKELITIDQSLKINSFHVVIGKEGAYTDHTNTGPVFSNQTSEAIEKAITEKNIAAGSKILISEVQISQNDKTIKVPDMVITLK